MEKFKQRINEHIDKALDIMTLPFELSELRGYKTYPATETTPAERYATEADEAIEEVEEIKDFYCNEFEEYATKLEDTPDWPLVEEFERVFTELNTYLYRTEWY